MCTMMHVMQDLQLFAREVVCMSTYSAVVRLCGPEVGCHCV